MKTRLKADLMLVFTSMLWGSSCLVTKIALQDMHELTLIALRFLIAFVLGLAVFSRKLKIDRRTILWSAVLSINYFVVMALMTYGVKYTTVPKAGFLTCLAGVFVPIICLIVFRKNPGVKAVICAVTTLVGVYMLTMKSSGGGLGLNLGDILCALCSVFFAIQIMLVAYAVKRYDALTLTVFQMGFVGVFNLVAAAFVEGVTLPQTPASWASVLWLSVACSITATLIQNIAQKNTSETHAGIIFTLEPLFAVLLAYIFLGDILTPIGYAGGGIIFASIIFLELDFSRFGKRLPKG